MAVLSITIPDQHVTRVLDAFATEYGYDDYVAGGGTATRAEFARAQVIRCMRDVVHKVESQAAVAAAEQALDPTPDLT